LEIKLVTVYNLSIYFHRTVIASPDNEQLSIELSISLMRSFGGNPAIRINSFPFFPSGLDCCTFNVCKSRISLLIDSNYINQQNKKRRIREEEEENETCKSALGV
jgi:hypothetical protein